MEQQNHDQMAEQYISAVENQRQSEGYTPDQSFTRGDMETCFVAGCQSMERLQEGCQGTFGQAIGSLKNGFLVRRQGWNGKGMFLFMRPADCLPDQMIVEQVKSLPWNFKEWVRHHPNENRQRFFRSYICMKAADGSIVNGWLASQTDMLTDDWELVNPEELPPKGTVLTSIKNKTIMAKFILEVSDEYIRNHAEPERMAASIDDKTSGMDALGALFDVIAFKHVKDEIDKGTTEFNVNIDDMDDDKARGIFNSTASRCAMLCVMKQANEKKKQDESKQE